MTSRYRIMEHDVACVVDSRDKIGEGAFWCSDEQAVYWLDVPMPSRIHRFDPATGAHDTWPMPEMVTAMAKRSDGTLLVASENGLNIFDPRTAAYAHLGEIEPHRPANRSNDGAPDAKSRFWIGTMQNNLGPDGEGIPITGSVGSLWKIEAGKPPVAVLDEIGITNGVAWSPDSTKLYVVDSLVDQIYICDFDLEAGKAGPRRVFSDAKDLGTPDGNAVDADGYLWSARWDGHCVARIAPDGAVDCIVPMSASLVTSCAFGGPELDTLYVTTARLGIDEETARRYPLQGGLFAFRPGVRGLKRPGYAG
jgi:L-arabinonolactonase